MRSHFLVIALVGTGLSTVGLLGPGCGGGGATPGAGGSSGSGVKTTSSSSSAVVSGSGGSGGAASPNTTLAMATPITLDAAPTSAKLQDTKTADYFTFSGTAGQRVLILANAYNASNANDTTGDVTDLVVNLYLPGQMSSWYAQDDDAWPNPGNTDSQLFVELPMTGTYYYTVEDCNAAFPNSSNCAPAGGVTQFAYTTQVIDLAKANAETVGVDEGADGGTVQAVPYVQVTGTGVPAGDWYYTYLDGNFTSPGETQVISFTPPTNTALAPDTRARAYFWLQPITSTNGDGSYANVLLSVKDKNGNVVAQADQKNYKDGDNPTDPPLQLSFPLFDTTPLATPAAAPSTLGQTYTLEVQNEGVGTAPYTNYYFIVHTAGALDYGQIEAEFPGAHSNDSRATAESITATPVPMSTTFIVDGNLVGSPADTGDAGSADAGGDDAGAGAGVADVDWYKVTLPSADAGPAASKFVVFCSAARAGSGLLGFRVDVYEDQATTSIFSLTETDPPMEEFQNSQTGAAINIDTGTTALYLKVSATGQSATNTGTYYNCGIATE